MKPPKRRWPTGLSGLEDAIESGSEGASSDGGASDEEPGGAGADSDRCDGARPEGDGEARASAAGAARESIVLSRKELGRELRRQAYQRAKLARAADPRHAAMKERAKQQRRELYQKVKEQRKLEVAEAKSRQKTAAAASRAEAQKQLTERVRGALRAAAAGGAPAIIERSPSPAASAPEGLSPEEVRGLMERLRAQSAVLAAEHRGGADE